MDRYVFITPECEKDARKHSILDKILKLKDQIETDQSLQRLDQFHPSPFYKKRFSNNKRLLVYDHVFQGKVIASFFWACSRKDPSYDKFWNTANSNSPQPRSIIKKYDVENELHQYIRGRLKKPIRSLNEISSDDQAYLENITQTKNHLDDLTILESKEWKDWIMHEEKRDHLSAFHRTLEILYQEIESKKITDEKITIYSSDETHILYKYFSRFNKLFLIAPLTTHDVDTQKGFANG